MAGHRIVRVEQRRPDLRFPLPDQFAARLDRPHGRGARPSREIPRRPARRRRDPGHAPWHERALHDHAADEQARPTASAPATAKSVNSSTRPALPPRTITSCSTWPRGATVTYNDPRRFGFMDLVAEAEMRVTSCSPASARSRSATSSTPSAGGPRDGRSTDLKAFLLDQRVIAGLGNIYVCEALFRSRPVAGPGRILPRQGEREPTDRCQRLVVAIREVLDRSDRGRRLDLARLRQADGSLGYFQHAFQVYGREGEPCATPGCRALYAAASRLDGRPSIWEMSAMTRILFTVWGLSAHCCCRSGCGYRRAPRLAAANRTGRAARRAAQGRDGI